MPEITLLTLDTTAKRLRSSRDDLAGLVNQLHIQVEAIKNAALPGIKKAVQRAAEHHQTLTGQIDAARHIFTKPKTVVLHGIKLGLEKGKGNIAFEDEDKVVALIEKKHADLTDTLIRTEKSVLKSALKNLDVATLKSIGCTVEETGDQIIIRFTDREVDKAVNALLKDAVETPES